MWMQIVSFILDPRASLSGSAPESTTSLSLSPSTARTQRLPVLYVFGREEVRMEECEKAFRELFPDLLTPVVILYDTVYHHCIGILFCSILLSLLNIFLSS